MSATPLLPDASPQGQLGALSTRVVAGLTGLDPKRLSNWRRTNLIPATALKPLPGYPSAYRWSEYRQARLAALLLEHGLHPRRLRTVLTEYCKVIPPHPELPTTVASQRAIVKPTATPPQTAEQHPQGTHFDFVSAAALRGRANEQVVVPALAKFEQESPLGRLRSYDGLVAIHPEIRDGFPTLAGTRIETDFLAGMVEAGESLESIASAYQLKPKQVNCAIQFERDLSAWHEVHAVPAR